MKLSSRLLAVAGCLALVAATPAAAHAAPKPDKPGKGKPAVAPTGKTKTVGAALDRAAGAKKAAETRARFAFPGTVVSAATGTVTISRKHRGVAVSRSFVLDPSAVVKRDGVVVSVVDVRPGDHAVAIGRRVDGVLVVFALNVESVVAEPVSDTATATITL